MTYKEAIKKIVEFAKKDKTSNNKVVKLGLIKPKQADIIKKKTGFIVDGYVRVIDKSSINHTLNNHGNKKKEAERGQIAVTEKDFEKIPEILKSENIVYAGKSKIGKDLILYEAIIGDVFYYIEEIRGTRKQLCLQTMYKRKPTCKNKLVQ